MSKGIEPDFADDSQYNNMWNREDQEQMTHNNNNIQNREKEKQIPYNNDMWNRENEE